MTDRTHIKERRLLDIVIKGIIAVFKMPNSKSNFITVVSFTLLAFIRGTTPLMAYFAVSGLNSTGSVVAAKSIISLVMFLLTLLTIVLVQDETRLQLKENFKNKSIYWKVLLIGLLQAAAPYLLVVYSLKYLPPTLLGVFMAATPWFTILMERLPFLKLKIKSTVNSYVKIGMVVGFPALILVMAPILHESLYNCSTADFKQKNMTTNSTIPKRAYPKVYDICLAPEELILGTLALIGGSFLWAASTVFWRAQRGDTHFCIASIGQNVVAAIVAITCWFLERGQDVGDVNNVWFETKTILGFMFLGIATGWLATILVQHLSKRIGPKPTNQVLALLPFIAFTEDCVFVKSVVSVHPWLIGLEMIGILMISGAAFLTNLPGSKKKRAASMLSEQLLNSGYESENESNYTTIRAEIDKYRTLPLDSEDDSSARELEIGAATSIDYAVSEDYSGGGAANSYPPLRQIVGDDLNKSSTLGRDTEP